jgi:hypothetical protein
MSEAQKMWRATISSTHVMEIRGIAAETEERAKEIALETQFDDFNVDHVEDIVHSVDVQEEEA